MPKRKKPGRKPGPPKVRVHVSIDPDVHARLVALAGEQKRGPSNMLEVILTEYLDGQDQAQASAA